MSSLFGNFQEKVLNYIYSNTTDYKKFLIRDNYSALLFQKQNAIITLHNQLRFA